jgi:hypothetical protein
MGYREIPPYLITNEVIKYGPDRSLYYICMCWLFGHRWKEVGAFPPQTLYPNEYRHFPGGYRCKKCVLCDLIVQEPLVYNVVDGELV